MRLLITGSRAFVDREKVFQVLNRHYDDWTGENLYVHDRPRPMFFDAFIVVHGACPTGADKWADEWTGTFIEPDDHYPHGVVCERHPAKWQEYGKPAGMIRNQEMVNLGADLVVAFYQLGQPNKGTRHCVETARRAGIDIEAHWANPPMQIVELPEGVPA